MATATPLFNSRILRSIVKSEKAAGVAIPTLAKTRIVHWAAQLRRGVLDRMSESSAEQTFNSEIFGTVLGYEQIGSTIEATLIPKRTGPSGRDTPDFVLGRFDVSAGIEQWTAVGEIKNSKTDLDHPQTGRANRETPVEQGFRYATNGKPGVSWVIVTNFAEIRLYKNGYVGAHHSWRLEELVDDEKLLEFYVLLRPEGLQNLGREPAAERAFRETISAGRDITEGFYGLYRDVQATLLRALAVQPASRGMSDSEIAGKAHKLLNRILFVAFAEKHTAQLLPADTLRSVALRGKSDGSPGSYWREYKHLFDALNAGGGLGGVAINAFNGGLFAPDAFLDAIALPNDLFTQRFRTGKGRRQSLEIVGVFGFDVYDFAEDLNVQALGAIFEQSLKDSPKVAALVRGVGTTTVTSQSAGGVYYTPSEITGHLVREGLKPLFASIVDDATTAAKSVKGRAGKSATPKARDAAFAVEYAKRLENIRVMDPACGSGAFLVEAFDQLIFEYDKANRAVAQFSSSARQRSLLDLDRLILRGNLHGRDILPESVEISRLSIWLRTAKRGERLESLDITITAGDSLRSQDEGRYDLVVGNPPWGASLENWTDAQLIQRFPDCGSEHDSYAIFVIRAWEMLRDGGVCSFILPNSWLTVSGYEAFRSWMLARFQILELTNVWKIFQDVNHDAMVLVARKRPAPVDWGVATAKDADTEIAVQALPRGRSEAEKLKHLAEKNWAIAHTTTHKFQWRQAEHRFEVIYRQPIADALDAIAIR